MPLILLSVTVIRQSKSVLVCRTTIIIFRCVVITFGHLVDDYESCGNIHITHCSEMFYMDEGPRKSCKMQHGIIHIHLYGSLAQALESAICSSQSMDGLLASSSSSCRTAALAFPLLVQIKPVPIPGHSRRLVFVMTPQICNAPCLSSWGQRRSTNAQLQLRWGFLYDV